ncbi:MAG: endolytic transglycosylase MltG [Lachnospiraceae bacterium]
MRTTIGIVIDTLGSIIIYAVIALAILFMAGQAKHYYDVGYGVFSQQGKDARGTGKVVAFTVEEGVKAPKLAEQLEEQGIIESARLFLIQERVSDYAGMYVAGTYALSSEMTTEEIMRVICAKEASPYEMPVEEAAPAAEPAAEEAPAAEAPAEE